MLLLQEQAGLLAAGFEPELAAEVGRPRLEAAAAILRMMPPHDFVQKQVRQTTLEPVSLL